MADQVSQAPPGGLLSPVATGLGGIAQDLASDRADLDGPAGGRGKQGLEPGGRGRCGHGGGEDQGGEHAYDAGTASREVNAARAGAV